jgi:hypothetical protein
VLLQNLEVLLLHGSGRSEKWISQQNIHVSFVREIHVVLGGHGGCCQSCWRVCCGMNRCTGYSALHVLCHECEGVRRQCWFENFCHLVAGLCGRWYLLLQVTQDFHGRGLY